MPNSPLVSIICLNYNHAPYLEKCLNSVFNQSYKNIELILVDDLSTDNSLTVIESWLKKHPEVKFIKNSQNLGSNKAFNLATTHANGSFLIDLAADDILLEHCVENQIKAFMNNPETAIVFGNAEIIDAHDIHLSYHFPVNASLQVANDTIKNTHYESILKGGNCMCSVSSMVKTSIFVEVGRYDESLVFEDLDLWLRIARKYQIAFIDKVLVQKRQLSNSMSSFFAKRNDFAKKLNESKYLILKKAYKMNTKHSEFKALLKRIHFLIKKNFEMKNYYLAGKLLALKLKVELTLLFRF